MKLGSLFDGIGGFPLVGTWFGIEPVWASEIEPAPISITKRNLPTMKHLGDITRINGGEIEPVDIITFGSPCQNLSVAGNREGLAGSESGLFMEAIRIIKEMREATNGIYPRFIVWENVLGALSSQRGRDFQTVLSEITETDIPMPKSGRWARAGMVRSEICDLAWRVLDAQYWGVPQHRERILLIVDFRKNRRSEILFEPESLHGHFEKSQPEGERATADTGSDADFAGERMTFCLSGNGVDRADTAACNGKGWKEEHSYTLNTVDRHAVCCPNDQDVDTANFFDSYNGKIGAISCTLGTNCGCAGRNGAIVLNDQGGNQMFVNYDKVGTLRAQGHPPLVFDGRGNGDGKTSPTITGDHNNRITDYTALCVGNGQTNNITMKPVSNTLDTMCDIQKVLTIDRAAFNQGENAQYDFRVGDNDTMPTLVAKGPHAVLNSSGGGVAGTLDASYYKGQGERAGKEREYVVTYMVAKGPHAVMNNIVRRITPRECERLQGFPDDWTLYGADDEIISDTQRYKALGNSVALPCVEFVLGKIAEELRNEEEDERR